MGYVQGDACLSATWIVNASTLLEATAAAVYYERKITLEIGGGCALEMDGKPQLRMVP